MERLFSLDAQLIYDAILLAIAILGHVYIPVLSAV